MFAPLSLFDDVLRVEKRVKSNESQVKAILFDLGGTLIRTTEIPQVMKKILEHHGINRSSQEIAHAWKKAEKGLDFQRLTTLLNEFWVRWNMRILRELQIRSNIRTLAEFIATHWWDYCNVTLYPDAEKALPRLKMMDLKIGVITNGLQSDMDAIMPKAGLQDFFDTVVVIDTLRKMKPDKEVFHYALQKLNTAPSRAIFIGDEIEADYEGAQRSGLTPYLIDRDGKTPSQGLNKIASLDDLFKLNIIK